MSSIIKAGYDEKRSILADNIPLDTPYSIIITPTSRCNFRCNYCVHSTNHGKNEDIGFYKQDLKWDTFLKICHDIEEFPQIIRAIHFHGWGEPLLNKDVYSMIKYIKDRNICQKINIITNGSLLTFENSVKLIDSGIDTIKISLQGLTSEKYLQICGNKIDFSNLINNVKFLYYKKKDCDIYVKVADIALEPGEDIVFFSTFKDISDRMFIEKIKPMINKVSNNEETSMNDFHLNMYGNYVDFSLVCALPFYMLHITPKGDVIPCCNYLDPVKLGNIHDNSLLNMWNSKKRLDFLKMMLSRSRNTQNVYPVCKGCTIPNATLRTEDELDPHAEVLLKRLLSGYYE